MNNVQRRFAWALLAAGLIAAWGGPRPAGADDGPVLNKTTVQIDFRLASDYWAPGAAKSVNATCWIPHVTFQVRKPIPSGASCSITFTKPDGSPWVELPCPVHDQDDETVVEYETPISQDLEPYKQKYITAGGTVGFKINMHDELGGTDRTLMSGKFRVNRISRSQGTPGTKNDADFSVDYDWALPIAYVWFHNTYLPGSPGLRVSTWLKGPTPTADLGGYLYYQGKLIGSTKGGGGTDYQVTHETSYNRPSDPRWCLWNMVFDMVHRTAGRRGANSELFYLDKNPGQYEFKLLRKGELARDLTFTAGDDGQIVDAGVAGANHLGTGRIVVPIKVLGTADGPWEEEAWRTDAFYGNPLAGFTAP